jgi:DNA-binding NtrC family response regulator
MKDSDRKEAKILVVDDDVELADTLTDHLLEQGYFAAKAYGGKEALDLLQERDFHLVITDLKMPGMDGMELLRRVKGIDRKVSVVLITGYGTIETAVDAIKLGAYDFIQKPFQFNELQIVIEKALDRHSLARELGAFKGLTLALLISIALWLGLGIVLVLLWR